MNKKIENLLMLFVVGFLCFCITKRSFYLDTVYIMILLIYLIRIVKPRKE